MGACQTRGGTRRLDRNLDGRSLSLVQVHLARRNRDPAWVQPLHVDLKRSDDRTAVHDRYLAGRLLVYVDNPFPGGEINDNDVIEPVGRLSRKTGPRVG